MNCNVYCDHGLLKLQDVSLQIQVGYFRPNSKLYIYNATLNLLHTEKLTTIHSEGRIKPMGETRKVNNVKEAEKE
jgi:hypothetical protein